MSRFLCNGSERVLFGLILLVVMGVMASGCLDLTGPDEHYLTNASPNGAVEITLEYTPPFGFGTHQMHVYGHSTESGHRGHRRKLLDFDLANDGANLGSHNCSVKWITANENEVATISCIGQEQEMAHYTINVSEALD